MYDTAFKLMFVSYLVLKNKLYKSADSINNSLHLANTVYLRMLSFFTDN